MFDKIKKGFRSKNKLKKLKAKAHGMSENEYDAYKSVLHETEYNEKVTTAKHAVSERYRKKREHITSGSGGFGGSGFGKALDGLTGMGKNVLGHLDESGGGGFDLGEDDNLSGLRTLNAALGGGSGSGNPFDDGAPRRNHKRRNRGRKSITFNL